MSQGRGADLPEMAPSPGGGASSEENKAGESNGFASHTRPAAAQPALKRSRQNSVSESDQADFARFHETVLIGIKLSLDIGKPLSEIRERELWRASQYECWGAYCKGTFRKSRTHANRLIKAWQIAVLLATPEPIGSTLTGITPETEWQVRPLYKLHDDLQIIEAWRKAVEEAGGQPSEEIVRRVVSDMTGSKVKAEKKESSRKQQLKEILDSLRVAFDSSLGVNFATAMGNLEKVLKLD